MDLTDTFDITGKGIITKQLRNGSTIDWKLSKTDFEGVADAVRIDWDIDKVDADVAGLGEGGAGIEMFSRLKSVLREADLKPGTIVQTEAAKDSFNATGSPASDAQTRAFKKGREDWYKANKEAAAKNYDETYGAGEFNQLDKDAQIIEMLNLGEAGKIDKVPARDDFNVRSHLPKAGFHLDDEGTLSGIVKADRRGRKIFEPLDPNGDLEAQIAAARSTGEKQLSLDLRQYDKQALDTLEALQAENIPYTWDDVAAVVPDLFIPGSPANHNSRVPPKCDETDRRSGPHRSRCWLVCPSFYR